MLARILITERIYGFHKILGINIDCTLNSSSRNSVIDIATDYCLDGQGSDIESQ
jgi:hypothetical protein